MLVEASRFALATFLLILVPGWLLSRAVFPRRDELRGVERAVVVLAGGVLLLMLVASVLGFVPHGDDRGYFQTMATGMPNVEGALVVTCILLFWVGLRRGAYPSVAARFPTLAGPIIERKAEPAPKP